MGMFDAIGGIAEAIGGKKTSQVYYNDALNNQINARAGSAGDVYNANSQDIADYSKKLKDASSTIDGLTAEDMQTLKNYIGKFSSGNAFDTYKQIGDYRTGLLKGFANDLASRGTAASNLQLAKLGYGGRGGSTYQNNALIDRISANLSPAYIATINGLGTDTNTLLSNDRSNYGVAMDAMGNRVQVPLRTANLALAPIAARNSNLSSNVAAINDLIQGAKANSAGFKTESPAWVDAMKSVGSSLNSTVDTGLSLFGDVASIYSGGAMGGGTRGSTPNGANQYTMPSGGIYQGYGGTGGISPWGGYGGYMYTPSFNPSSPRAGSWMDSPALPDIWGNGQSAYAGAV